MNKFLLFSVFSMLTINVMAQEKIVQTAGRDQLGDFAPKFAELNDDVLFGEVWSRTDKLGLRDRSVVTIASLISQGITDNSLVFHLQSARKNGITRTEIAEIITHIGFYAGWPKAWAAFNLAKGVWAEDTAGEDAKAAFQREMIFPIGEPNTTYAQYFTGNSYLAPISRRAGIDLQCHVRTPLPEQLAYPPCDERRRTDADRCSRARLVSGRGQTRRGDPPRHSDPYLGECQALARGGGR